MKSLVMPCLLLCVVSVGCSQQNEQLSGTVAYEDGTPVTMGEVVFVKEMFQAIGTIQEDGTYTVGSLEVDDGLPAGTYQVYIDGAVDPGEDIDSPEDDTPLVATKFTDPSTSGLTCEVPVEGNTFDITVTPYEE